MKYSSQKSRQNSWGMDKEFDSQHDFVALLDLKWGEHILFWGGARRGYITSQLTGSAERFRFYSRDW
jgi:hypothetical protein